MTEERKTRKRLTQEEINDLMYMYLCTDTKCADIAAAFDVRRDTVHRIVRRVHHPVRRPGAGNFTNHPRKVKPTLSVEPTSEPTFKLALKPSLRERIRSFFNSFTKGGKG